MKMAAAWLCVVGGGLWGLKPLYDWIVLDRRVNTGYVASDFTDYVKFLFPLFCLGGLFVLYSLYKERVKKAAVILAAALLFNSLFHFFEIYFTDSGIPFGLLFLFSGTLLLLIGARVLAMQLRAIKSTSRLLPPLADALFVTTLLFCVLPFVSGSLPETALTLVMVALMLLIGFSWAGMGAVLVKMIKEGVPVVHA